MKTEFICEKCGRGYPTEKQAIDCETTHAEEAAKKKALAEEKESRKNTIDRLISEYIKDYGYYSYNDKNDIANIFDRLFL